MCRPSHAFTRTIKFLGCCCCFCYYNLCCSFSFPYLFHIHTYSNIRTLRTLVQSLSNVASTHTQALKKNKKKVSRKSWKKWKDKEMKERVRTIAAVLLYIGYRIQTYTRIHSRPTRKDSRLSFVFIICSTAYVCEWRNACSLSDVTYGHVSFLLVPSNRLVQSLYCFCLFLGMSMYVCIIMRFHSFTISVRSDVDAMYLQKESSHFLEYKFIIFQAKLFD